jgi:hypothetical protein
MVHKLVDPPRGIIPTLFVHHKEVCAHQELKHYEVAHDTFPFKVIFYFHSLFQPLAFKTILATCVMKIFFFPSIINLHDEYLNLHSFHQYFLIASFHLQPRVCNR